MKIGIIGLGKMGSRIAIKLLEEGHEVVAWNRSWTGVEELRFKISHFAKASRDKQNSNLKVADTIGELVKRSSKPRVIWVMVTAGEATENVLNEITKFIDPEDIIIDGGNSNYKDTERRYWQFKEQGVRYLGIGVSGGIIAAKEGYPMMIGGDKEAYYYIVPLLNCLARPNGGYEYFGTGGAGHFVKMVHNGIEYGMMQALGEGFEVLQKSPYKFDLLKISKIWQRGTIISGFLIDRAKGAFSKDPNLLSSIGPIAESGEARWTVEQAKEEKIPVEIIEKSLEFRLRSQKDPKIQKSFTARVINALRREFGGHKIKF